MSKNCVYDSCIRDRRHSLSANHSYLQTLYCQCAFSLLYTLHQLYKERTVDEPIDYIFRSNFPAVIDIPTRGYDDSGSKDDQRQR